VPLADLINHSSAPQNVGFGLKPESLLKSMRKLDQEEIDEGIEEAKL
jgi:hypothetical protein